ncbi:PIRIN [Ceraceosorus bombacis]|uniref:PIRIN n=1 Tax=Ceraceosorus bombacis TaxID=401625 RepID=A0A0P1BLR5_9BASI|nr:PIRIN [Ceraceosorus bombacis]
MTQVSRRVVQEVPAVETPEGAGAVVRRSIGTPALRNLSPFLMLDHFRIGEGAGFPDHPHRGMTTVTYMLSGQVQHEDFAGHAGTIGPGSLQWMTAGRGIVHAEMPLHRDPKTNAKLEDPIGLQLWIDLPQEMKSSEPFYQESAAQAIPTALPRADQPVETEGKAWSIKVISGESHGVQSKVRTPDRGHCWYFDNGAWIEHAGDVQEEARFVIIAGEPLKQNVVQHGPFVMTSKADIYQAFQDYAGGKNGFERAPGWRSKIG